MADKVTEDKKNLYAEFGATGYYTFSGQFQTEYQTQLSGGKAFEVYEKMLRGSSIVKAMFKAVWLPLISAEWEVKPPIENDKQLADITERVKQNLFYGLNVSWSQLLYNILLHLPYGFYPFELVWKNPAEEKPGENELQIQLKKLAPRHPKTIKKWYKDENGGLQELEQWTYVDKGGSTSYLTIKIPIDKLILFVNEQDGDNYEGVSILRPGFRHWYMNDKLYTIASIGAEKFAVGTPIITFDPDYWSSLSDDEQTNQLTLADDIIKNYRVHEYAGVKVPPGMNFSVIPGNFNYASIENFILHNDIKICQSVLASFLTLGEKAIGSYALSKDQSDFFLMSLKAVGKNICDTINTHLIPKMVNYNYDNITQYPKLSFTLENFDINNLITSIRNAVLGKILTPSKGIEEEIRRLLSLPAIEADELIQPGPIQQPVSIPPEEIKMSEDTPLRWRRDLTDAEKRVNLAEIKTNMVTMETTVKNKLKSVILKQQKSIVEQLKEGKTSLEVPFMEEVTAIWTEAIKKTEIDSMKQVGKEFKTDVNINYDKIEQKAKEKALLIADKHKADMLLDISNFYKGVK